MRRVAATRAPARIGRRRGLRIDIHTHVALPDVLAKARKLKMTATGPGTQDWIPPISRAEHARQSDAQGYLLFDPKSRLADMNANGIDIQVISMNLPNKVYWAPPRAGGAVCRACNEGIAEFVAAVPDRYVGIGTVPLQDATLAAAELEYAVKRLGLRGAMIPSHIRAKDLGEDRFRPFWRKAEALGVPVYVHPRGFTHDERLHKFFLWNSVGQPLEETLAMTSLIHEGIMEDFPRLKVVIAHGGGYLPYYPGRGERSFESRPEPRAKVAKPPSAYLPRFHYDSVIFDRDMLAFLVKKVGSGQVMMGTDYPRGEVEEDPVGFVAGTGGLSPADRRRIMGDNAARLFGIA